MTRRGRRDVPAIRRRIEAVAHDCLPAALLFAEARQLVPPSGLIARATASQALRAISRKHLTTGLWTRCARSLARARRLPCGWVTPFNGRSCRSGPERLAERRDWTTKPRGGRLSRCRGAVRPRRDPECALPTAISVLSTRRGSRDAARFRTASRGRRRRWASGEDDYARARFGSQRKRRASTAAQPLADYLVWRALSPLTSAASPYCILQLRIVHPDGESARFRWACVAIWRACSELGARRVMWLPSDGHRRGRARRNPPDNGRSYGVDLNPTAVQARNARRRFTAHLSRPSGRRRRSFLGASVSSLRLPPCPSRRGAIDALPRRCRTGGARQRLAGALFVRYIPPAR